MLCAAMVSVKQCKCLTYKVMCVHECVYCMYVQLEHYNTEGQESPNIFIYLYSIKELRQPVYIELPYPVTPAYQQ